ncbi:uncharacterized protein LOC128389981 [Panonychus citri]|uniref:uncharacterized protein LOC128389981 n=1 Tax=Panonychus citri TaxID=50023 RepID=UPI0023079D7B|nr:uncharacterized protein LOC128389981 [Panonychus citri]
MCCSMFRVCNLGVVILVVLTGILVKSSSQFSVFTVRKHAERTPNCWPYNIRPYLDWIEKPAEFYKAIIGSTFELSCSALGSPAPRVRWLKNLDYVRERSKTDYDELARQYILDAPYSQLGDVSSLNTARLVIPVVTWDTHKYYSCLIDNGLDQIELEVKIEPVSPSALVTTGKGKLHGTPSRYERYSISDLESTLLVKPRINSWTEIASAKVGYSTVLRCRSSDTPMSSTTGGGGINNLKKISRIQGKGKGTSNLTITDHYWVDSLGVRLGENKENFASYEKLASGDLFIKTVNWNDMGYFQCITSNQYGSDGVRTLLLLVP